MEGREYQKVQVACDDRRGTTGDGQLQDRVVVGVATDAESDPRLDDIHAVRQHLQERLALVPGQIPVQFLAAQYLRDFGQGFGGCGQSPGAQDQPKGAPG